jgi:hypothetical protein
MSAVDVLLVFVYCLELIGVIGVAVWIAYWLLKIIQREDDE